MTDYRTKCRRCRKGQYRIIDHDLKIWECPICSHKIKEKDIFTISSLFI